MKTILVLLAAGLLFTAGCASTDSDFNSANNPNPNAVPSPDSSNQSTAPASGASVMP